MELRLDTGVLEPSVNVEPGEHPEPRPISLIAYHRGDKAPLEIMPAGRWRDWMNATDSRFANRCLPLLMANQSGWWILNRDAVTVVWDGGPSPAATTVSYDREVPEPGHGNDSARKYDLHVASHFGYGIVTWEIPYIFRTEPGYNLQARGPANLPKDGVSALEGLIETDWSVAPFTMSWKLTRPGLPVRFEPGEPICMIVPQRRGELEAVVPRTSDLDCDPSLRDGYESFRRSRESHRLFQLLSVAGHPGATDGRAAWEKHYFKGETPTGEPAREHETKRRLRTFDGAAR